MREIRLATTMAMALGILLLGGDATRAQVACGDTLTVDTTLTGPLTCTGPGLIVGADGITLDCANFTITGSGTDVGILLDGRTGVTVRNCVVSDFATGFRLIGSSTNYLTRNGALANTEVGSGGFSLSGSDANVLEVNRSSDNVGRGYLLSDSDGNVLVRSSAVNNQFRGIDLTNDSIGNAVVVNTVDSNLSGGIVVSNTSSGNILYRNQVSGSGAEGFAMLSSTNYVLLNSATQNMTFGYSDTTGPANLYLLDFCAGNLLGGSSPTGLCAPQP